MRRKLLYGEKGVPPKVRCSMVIVYSMAALIGGLTGCALLWPFGAAIAIISMPIVGSLFALLVAVLVYVRSSDEGHASNNRLADLDLFQSSQAADSSR